MEKRSVKFIVGWLLLVILFELISLYFQDVNKLTLAKVSTGAMLIVIVAGSYWLPKRNIEIPIPKYERINRIFIIPAILMVVILIGNDKCYTLAGILVLISWILGSFENLLAQSLAFIFSIIASALIAFKWIRAEEYVAKGLGIFMVGAILLAIGVLIYTITIRRVKNEG